MRRQRASLVLALVMLVGCGAPASEQAPRAASATTAPLTIAATTTVTSAVATSRPATTSTTRDVEADARAATVLITVERCDGTVTGSGFLVDDRTVLTNRHVVEGASRVGVRTWDGTELTVRTVSQVLYADLGIVTVEPVAIAPLALAAADPPAATPVRALGYPLGGPFIRTNGYVAEYVTNPALGGVDRVMRLDIEIQPGNSGGPVVDEHGSVVAIVFAVERATRYSLAIPASIVGAARRDLTGIEAIAPC